MSAAPYSLKAYAGGKHPTALPLALILHTTHQSKASLDIEIAACTARGERKEIAYIQILDHANAETKTVYF